MPALMMPSIPSPCETEVPIEGDKLYIFDTQKFITDLKKQLLGTVRGTHREVRMPSYEQVRAPLFV